MPRRFISTLAGSITSAFLALGAAAPAYSGDTTKSGSGTGFVGAPFAKYSPETGFAGGAVGLYYFRLTSDTGASARPSSVSGGVTYTQKKQISTGIDYDFYFGDGLYHWSGGFDYKRIPFDFYGVGNVSPKDPVDNYTPLWRGGDAEFTRTFARTDEGEGFDAGVAAEIRDDKILSSNPGGSIAAGSVPGSRGGLSSGAGFVAMYDTRDNIFSSHTGTYVKFKSMFYGHASGSSFSFNRYDVDVRKFYPVTGSHTIALQGLVELVRGDEPFYTMAQLGGDVNTRGYFQGRFRDNDMAVLQAEYRLPLFWRFGFAAFVSAGEVAGGLDSFKASTVKYSAGAGIRFIVVEDERLGVRLDFGSGRDSSELYFSILEAF
jgi:outer membrane protein assembly factor BamA